MNIEQSATYDPNAPRWADFNPPVRSRPFHRTTDITDNSIFSIQQVNESISATPAIFSAPESVTAHTSPLTNLLVKEVDRKEFLAYLGSVALAVFGITNLLKVLYDSGGKVSSTSAAFSHGYGSGAYGGPKDRVQISSRT